MPTLRLNDAPVRLRIPVGDVLVVVAPAGSSVYVVHPSDLDPATTVTGTSQNFGPYPGTKTLTLTCTAGAIDFSVVDEASVAYNAASNTLINRGTGAPIGSVDGGGKPVTISGDKSTTGTLTAVIGEGWRNDGGIWHDAAANSGAGADIPGATSVNYPKSFLDGGKSLTYKSSNLPYTPPPITIDPAPALVLVGNRSGIPGQVQANSSSFTDYNQRMRTVNCSGVDIGTLEFEFGNHVASASALSVGTAPLTLQVGFLPGGSALQNPTRNQATWDGVGALSKTLAPGELAHTVEVVLATPWLAGAPLDLWENLVTASAMAAIPVGNIPSTIASFDVNEASATSVASEAFTGTVSGRAVTRQVLPPLAIRGRPVSSAVTPNPGVGFLVDSNGIGAGDSTTGAPGYTGFVQRGIGSLRPWTNLGQAGYAWYAAIQNGSPSADLLRKLAVLARGGIKYVFCNLLGNDVSQADRTADQCYADALVLKAYLEAMGIRLVLINGSPRTNDTNTGPNTSDAAGAMDKVLAYNALLAANNGVGYGYFNRHVVLADPANPYLYRTDAGGPLQGADGIHHPTLGHTLLANALQADVPRLFPAF